MEGYNIISAEKVGNVRRYLSSLVQDYVINGYSYSIRYNRHYATAYGFGPEAQDDAQG